jgi:Tfp pilus assembly PilM family ATPase
MMLRTLFRSAPADATLPLGIDIGQTRVRAALLEAGDDGPRLVAVATRDRSGPLPELICEALADLGTTERRCVLGVTEPDGLVRPVVLPSMPPRERAQAARFEADRFVTSDEPLVVRLFPLDANARYALGIAKRRVIDERLRIAREAGLACVAIDNAAFAYARLTGSHEAVLDVGAGAATLHVFGDPIPSTSRFDTGGERLTAALAESLAIDVESAERRKRTHGLAGAAAYTVHAFVEAVSGTLVAARSRGMRIDRLSLVGNGTRLDALPPALEISTGLSVRRLDTIPIPCSTLPPDVVRAELADWALAIGLALRGAPA